MMTFEEYIQQVKAGRCVPTARADFALAGTNINLPEGFREEAEKLEKFLEPISFEEFLLKEAGWGLMLITSKDAEEYIPQYDSVLRLTKWDKSNKDRLLPYGEPGVETWAPGLLAEVADDPGWYVFYKAEKAWWQQSIFVKVDWRANRLEVNRQGLRLGAWQILDGAWASNWAKIGKILAWAPAKFDARTAVLVCMGIMAML